MSNIDDLPKALKEIELFAWIGLDELGSGQYGIKQGIVPAGYIPLVSMHKSKIERLRGGLEPQSKQYNKKIRLLRFKLVEVIAETEQGEG